MSILAAAGGQPITSFLSAQALVALVTLTILEVVLGIDNIIFISVLADRLPGEQQNKARMVGLLLAMILRVLLLLCISWIMSLTSPIPLVGEWFIPIMGDDAHLNWRDVILLVGGVFLIYKATTEIHEKLEGAEHAAGGQGRRFVRQRHHADSDPRHRLQPRQRHHGGREWCRPTRGAGTWG